MNVDRARLVRVSGASSSRRLRLPARRCAGFGAHRSRSGERRHVQVKLAVELDAAHRSRSTRWAGGEVLVGGGGGDDVGDGGVACAAGFGAGEGGG
jgi:hypothetical protein